MSLYATFVVSKFVLSLGCFLIAFSPFLSMFFLVMYQKSQLVIIVTTSAFFFLLSALAASLVWFVFSVVGLGDIFASILIPGIFSGFFFRCLFVSLYHKVERVIHVSMEKEAKTLGGPGNNGDGNNGTAANNDETNANTDGNNNTGPLGMQEIMSKLKLQLNDASCGLAAGVGYGGMHTILFYGTLLASEATNDNIVYQNSCPNVPGLVQSAMFAFCFSILDIFWMLLTFFGMRRRLLYHRGDMYSGEQDTSTSTPAQLAHYRRRAFGSYFGNSRVGGNMALLTVLVTHLFASTITVVSNFSYGCHVTLPALFVLVIATIYAFWSGCAKIYMPPENTAISISRTASRLDRSNGIIGGGGGSDDVGSSVVSDEYDDEDNDDEDDEDDDDNDRNGSGGGGGRGGDENGGDGASDPILNYRNSSGNDRYDPDSTGGVQSSFKMPRKGGYDMGNVMTPTTNNKQKHRTKSSSSNGNDRYGIPPDN